MSIETPEELVGLRAAGSVVSLMLKSMKEAVEVGATTAELDEVGASVMRQHSSRPAPSLVYRFPGVSCISVNQEAVHGNSGAEEIARW
jgi:methionyl aminopeptidase